MKTSIILLCAGLAYGSVQVMTALQPQQIKQRMVKVYVMAPEGNYVVWEKAKDDSN